MKKNTFYSIITILIFTYSTIGVFADIVQKNSLGDTVTYSDDGVVKSVDSSTRNAEVGQNAGAGDSSAAARDAANRGDYVGATDATNQAKADAAAATAPQGESATSGGGDTSSSASQTTQGTDAGTSSSSSSSSSTSSDPTKIIVTERVPGGKCTCIAEGAKTQGEAACGTPETRKYECTVPQGLAGFQEVFAQIIRYFIYIVLLLGVLGIVGLGIAWAFAGGDDVKMKTTLKHWGVNVLIGLILLFLFSYILMALAPWVFQS